MKICILNVSYEDSNSPIKEYELQSDPGRWLDGHECELHLIKKSTAVRQVQELARQNFDLFINLCDGAWDEDRPGIEVVQALQRLGVPFTGAGAGFYEPTREEMKLVSHYWGVNTPAYLHVSGVEDIKLAAKALRYPLIVKHPNSYNSIGLTRESRVTNAAQLQVQAKRMLEAFGGALVEEFVEGREFTVLVSENPRDALAPLAYQPVEFSFPKGDTFKHFDLKWVNYAGMQCKPVRDRELAERLKDASRKLFVGLNGTGYGRCDLRLNAAGELFMLEINPNCSIFYPPEQAGSADFILLNDPAGHRGFLDTIIESAQLRARKQSQAWTLQFNNQSQFGMYAAHELRAGELIVAFEEAPHNLVSKTHAMRKFSRQQKRWFGQFAYPLSDDTYVTWSENAVDWKPLNHSCDPSAWLDGLNVVARRPLKRGEHITMDYATFYTDQMPQFACNCGAASCRGVVRGTDYKKAFVAQYGEHVSDFVRTKRLALNGAAQPQMETQPAKRQRRVLTASA